MTNQRFCKSLLDDALQHAAQVAEKPLEEMLNAKQGSARRNLHDDITVLVIDLEGQFQEAL